MIETLDTVMQSLIQMLLHDAAVDVDVFAQKQQQSCSSKYGEDFCKEDNEAHSHVTTQRIQDLLASLKGHPDGVHRLQQVLAFLEES